MFMDFVIAFVLGVYYCCNSLGYEEYITMFCSVTVPGVTPDPGAIFSYEAADIEDRINLERSGFLRHRNPAFRNQFFTTSVIVEQRTQYIYDISLSSGMLTIMQ